MDKLQQLTERAFKDVCEAEKIAHPALSPAYTHLLDAHSALLQARLALRAEAKK